MKVAVLGASGRAGSEIVKELAARGHQVTGVARNPDAVPQADGITPAAGDATDPAALSDTLRGSDAVISALPFDVTADKVVAIMREAGVKRLLVTGGAASLKNKDGVKLHETDAIPEAWKPAVMKGVNFLNALRDVEDIDWLFFSPAFNFVVGPRTESFRMGNDDMIGNSPEESRISFADYAIAMADELESHAHSRERITIGY